MSKSVGDKRDALIFISYNKHTDQEPTIMLSNMEQINRKNLLHLLLFWVRYSWVQFTKLKPRAQVFTAGRVRPKPEPLPKCLKDVA